MGISMDPYATVQTIERNTYDLQEDLYVRIVGPYDIETPFTLEGYLLIIDHGMGLNSAFLHSSELLVREGEAVRQGQVIGRISATGRATGPHLHWGLTWRGARLDPLLFTGPMR